ncbi:glycoside hydrolase family 88 protein [Sphingobacterium sp. PCS056]|uniref:glycoside hydrolase family 88/105 protein n=1 Tax=Sphingobacterium sp. PCS056 TaxID=2931400 RepID=UPI00200E2BF8|nr:glycoside hydrolase family 88 protein [Sphingobacterium sp. PCS056]UPZ38266.1 glycoside hydrolase family 88 protein [Sphingobacterium sp. PCS056]
MILKKRIYSLSFLLLLLGSHSFGQQVGSTIESNDSNTPLHLLQPDYPVRYGEVTTSGIKKTIDRVYAYLNNVTPVMLEHAQSHKPIKDIHLIDTNSIFKKGDFRLISYEWGVTYGAMLRVTETTHDQKYADYTHRRLELIADVLPQFRALEEQYPGYRSPVHSVLQPHALDDAGAMCAAMIKAQRSNALKKDINGITHHYIDYILNKEFRLSDGTLARNRPLPNTLWLDDLYMSLPALAQMSMYSEDPQYMDEAIRQFWLFTDKMFLPEKGLYRHGWVQDMDPHPAFHWARANGWALLTMVELLNVLSDKHAAKGALLAQYKKHVQGLASLQDGTGFWHQLLDRNNSYLETSATAIYAYCIARGINAGWLDKKAYGPMVLQAWNAVDSQVNHEGQVMGTCVGTGMGFDPAFYYFRPVNKFAAHGYGPVLLAGAEIYELINNNKYVINDSSVQF